MVRRTVWATVFTLLLLPAGIARSQFGVPVDESPQLDTARTQRWKVGLIISASRGPCAGIFGTVSVPIEWPEQDVKIVDEQISDNVGAVRYRNLDGGVRQMLVTVPRLNPGEKAEALVTFEITRRAQVPPADPSALQLPTNIPRAVRRYLGSSPKIDSRSTKIRTTAKEITAGKETAWETVKAIHDWVQTNIEHTNARLQGALAALRAKQGNHEDLANLFVALCRAEKIPARIVWVPGYCYAEFYLENDKGEGVWVPCELIKNSTFGAAPNQHLILQKGDNIRVPEQKEPQRFVPEFVKGKTGRGLGRPGVRFVRQLMPAQ